MATETAQETCLNNVVPITSREICGVGGAHKPPRGPRLCDLCAKSHGGELDGTQTFSRHSRSSGGSDVRVISHRSLMLMEWAASTLIAYTTVAYE